jgi:energy-coupling factor transporter ATP-binding protein EcfA2
MAQFALSHLSFTYPDAAVPALDDVSLSVTDGSYVVLCGKSGCGKTTLLRHLKTALEPHGTRTGEVRFEDRLLDQVPQRQQTAAIGFVMQDPEAQVVTDKVWHELAFGLESLGYEQRTMRLRVAEMASYFGMQDWFHRDVRDLSGGQKQLLNLASVMAMQPHCLVLDEPTSQLDPISAGNFLDTVRRVNRELGTTIILSEHRLEQVFPAADQVIVMDDGRITHEGDPRTVGQALCREGHDLRLAMPAPLRIYEAVSDASCDSGAETAAGEGPAPKARPTSDRAGNVDDAPSRPTSGKRGNARTTQVSPDADEAPLTVREGRRWLGARVAKQPALAQRSLPSEAPLAEDFEPAIEAKGLWLRYDRNAPDVLHDANLRVPRGVLQAVVGGNGTGKSTLLRALCGVIAPYRGTVRVDGQLLAGHHRRRAERPSVALLPQDPTSLFLGKSVEEDLRQQAHSLGLSDEESYTRVQQIAARLEIDGILSRHPFDLSGGEQQRATLAKVLLGRPHVLLLDEPTKGIDEYLKECLAALLVELTAQGVTVLMASHDIEFCARHADRMSMFFDGAVVATNTPRRFFSENGFYTTAANRMARGVFPDAVTDEEVIALCR